MTNTLKPEQVKPILEFMNSGAGRSVRSVLGSVLLAQARHPLLKGLGVVLFASGPLDFCPTNAALGYPLSGQQTRERLAQK